jgi:predicted HTH domain antitoxin
MGNQAPVDDNTTVFSTSTRNFNNRMGKGAQVYLGSAELAAVCALLGCIPNVQEYMEIVAERIDPFADQTTFKEIASQVQLFQSIEQKETFIFVLGALTSRLISLHKAAEIMEMDTEVFLKILELMGIDFSYLTVEDIALQKTW